MAAGSNPKSKAPAAVRAAAEQAAVYDVLSPLDMDLVRYDIGSQVELTHAQAAPLLGHTVAIAPPQA